MIGFGPVTTVIRRFAATYPLRLAGGIVLLAAAVGAGIGLLAVSGELIAGAALAGLGLVAFDVFGPSAAIRLFAVTRTAARYAERLASHDATLRFLADLRIDAFRGMVGGFRGSERPAVLFNRLTGDLDALDGVLIRLAIPVSSAVLVLAGTGIALAGVDGVLAAAVIGPVAIGGVLVPVLIGLRAARPVRRKLFALDAARVRAADLDRGRIDLAAAGVAEARRQGIADAFDRASAAETTLARLDAMQRLAAGLGGQAAVIGAVLAAGPLLQAGAIGGPAFAAVTLVALAIGEVIAPLRTIALDVGRWSVAARRLLPILADDARESRKNGRQFGEGGAPGVRIRGVRAGDTTGAARLSDVDLDIPAGAVVALVGPSGAGKTTLLQLIAGSLRPVAGMVEVGCGGRGEALRPRIAVLGQRTELFRGTIGENLRLARPDADDALLWRVLSQARLADSLGAEGLDYRLGDEGSGLSGGERRRLALARLMLQDAGLVLVDEPTEGLDEETARAVFEALLRFAEGRTLVFATHRPYEAARADGVVTVRAGRVGGVAATAGSAAARA